MPGSSNPNSGSFIPKRGTSRRRKPKSKSQIFIFSIITYSLLFAALLAAGGTYFYKNYLKSQLQTEVASLKTAITTFSTQDLARVRDFDVTLKRATNRVDHAASIVDILAIIDEATVGPVQLDSLTVTRNVDEGFTLNGSIITDTFDAAIFQRKIYKTNEQKQLFSDVVVESVVVNSPETIGLEDNGQQQEVVFEVTIEVPLDEVLYDPATARLRDDIDTSDDFSDSQAQSDVATDSVTETNI